MRFHTSLPVRDIDETIAFYRVLFDTEPVKAKPDYAKFLPQGLALNISFHETPTRAELRTLHLGLEMPDRAALERAYERLSEAGFTTGARETSVCCYARQDKFHVTDPTGYEWELYLLLEDTDRKMSAPTDCCASTGGPSAPACC